MGKAKDIKPITKIPLGELVPRLKENMIVIRTVTEQINYKTKLTEEDRNEFITSVFAHMQLTMQKMDRFDSTAYLISYLFAMKDLTDDAYGNVLLADDFKLDLSDLNAAEIDFLACEEIDYKITHGRFDDPSEAVQSKIKEQKALAEQCMYEPILKSLQVEVNNYLDYIKDKKGEAWNSRRAFLKGLETTLTTNAPPHKKCELFFEVFNLRKAEMAKNPDPYSSTFFRELAYKLASLFTLGMFNLYRTQYRSSNANSTYVRFSVTFSGEKFVNNLEARNPLRPR